MNAADFFKALYRGKIGQEAELSTLVLPGSHVERFGDLKSALKYFRKATKANTYFGLSLVKSSAAGRGKLDDMICLPGMWADFDFAGPGHKKENLPDEDDVKRLRSRLGKTATITVHSGHGWQCYWLFDRLMWITDDRRAEAVEYMRAWGQHLSNIADGLGFELDPVWDLTRVFRVPGTVNSKVPDDPKPVKIIDTNEAARYTFKELDFRSEASPGRDTTMARSGATSPSRQGEPPSLDASVLRPDVEPPFDKFFALTENDATFAKTWERKRKDLPSQSEYDASLAAFAGGAGWTAEETAALIIAHRRKHGQDMAKVLDRQDYLQRTIHRAFRLRRQERAISELETAAAEPEITDEKRDALLQQLSDALGLPIKQWVQVGRENARYRLDLMTGEQIQMGTTKEIMTFRHVSGKLYEQTGAVLKRSLGKGAKWDQILRILGKIKTVIGGEDMTTAHQVTEWVESYLDRFPPVEEEKDDAAKEAVSERQPFRREGKVYLSATELRRDLKVTQGEWMGHADLCAALRFAGWDRKNVTVWFGGTEVGRSFYYKDVSE